MDASGCIARKFALKNIHFVIRNSIEKRFACHRIEYSGNIIINLNNSLNEFERTHVMTHEIKI